MSEQNKMFLVNEPHTLVFLDEDEDDENVHCVQKDTDLYLCNKEPVLDYDSDTDKTKMEDVDTDDEAEDNNASGYDSDEEVVTSKPANNKPIKN